MISHIPQEEVIFEFHNEKPVGNTGDFDDAFQTEHVDCSFNSKPNSKSNSTTKINSNSVLISPQTLNGDSKSFIIAVDNSRHAEFAIRQVIDQHIISHSDFVTLINVRDHIKLSDDFGVPFGTDFIKFLWKLDEEARELSKRLLLRFAQVLKNNGCRHVRAISMRGDHCTMILEKVEELKPDGVVFGLSL
ncbi:hypothetical protein BKA69DRAFT_1125593 [Paraphysoderma sedebokerense]|nr:hypothetical protein BKA69DRAFT_1125593 [Paraphysoderma sedebokerense]